MCTGVAVLFFTRMNLGAADDFGGGFQAGAARVTITPTVETFTDANANLRYDEGEAFEDLNKNGKWDPVWMAGNRGGRSALGIESDIWARAVALKTKVNGMKGDGIILVALDLIGYMFDEADTVRSAVSAKTGLPKSNIFVASTHDHSGPDTIGVWGDNGNCGKDPIYMEWLRGRAVDSAVQAWNAAKPAKLIFGRKQYPDEIDDPRPPRVINDNLLSFRAVDVGGKTIATVVNFALHAEVLSEKNRRITPDFPDYLRGHLESHYGGVALFFPADIGGMQTPKVIFHTFAKAKRLGEAISKKVIASQKKQEPITIDKLSVKSMNMVFPIQNPRFVGAIQKGMFGDTAKRIEMKGEQMYIPVEAAIIELGPAQIATVPGEVFPELGHQIREKMLKDFPFMLGLCNNEIGYILPKDQWHWDWYEESMSLGPETGPLLLDAFAKLLP